jgi:hypothetical protein
MRIDPATVDDLSDVRAAYEHGRDTQRACGTVVWPEFPDAAIQAEIHAGRLFRVIMDSVLAGVFSVALDDRAIWGPLDGGEHLYLHRIARTAQFSGRGLVDAILIWADEECGRLGRIGLRMDTWAGNNVLIEYYQQRGFRLVGERRLGIDSRLPAHYHGNAFALLERQCPEPGGSW